MKFPNPASLAAKDVPPSAAGYAFAEFTVDIAATRLMHDGTVITLPSRIFDVLVYLIEHRERSVKKDEIIAAIWDNVIVTDDSLIHAISVLRRALGDEPHQHKYIETIPRRGYRFVGKVRIIEPQANQVAPQPVAEEKAPTLQDMAPAPAVAIPDPVIERAKPQDNVGSFRSIRPALGTVLLAAAASVVLLVAAIMQFRDNPAPVAPAINPPNASVRLYQPSPQGMSIVSGGVLSPDGRYLAFVARDDVSGKTGLWVRALQSGELHLVWDTENAAKPFWSPDASRIGFFANGKLFTSDLTGERQQMIASAAGAAGATWGLDDTILFADWARGLYAVPASGDGEVTPILLLEHEARDIAIAWPQFFPDNHRFLYQIVSLDPERVGAYVGDLETGQSFKLLDTTSTATFAPPHHLLYIQKDMLIAEELDPQRLELTGHAIVVARGISEPALAAENFVSASTDLLAFQHGIKEQNLIWFDRDGAQVDELAKPTVLFHPRLSPDGARLLASSSVTSNPGLWITSLDREEFARFETDAVAPIWSRDGQRIAFTSRDGADMLVRSSDGRGVATRLMSDDSVKILGDWSPDGRHIVYTRQGPTTGLDLWTLDVATGTATPLLTSAHNETQARISPDGNWIAYASDESGVLETYVARFPDLGAKLKASVDGGGQPQWRADQGELFYLSFDQAIMTVGVDNTEPMALTLPQQLFRTPIAGKPGDGRDNYAVNATGTRFLIDASVNEGNNQEITIMVNWAARLNADSPEFAAAPLP